MLKSRSYSQLQQLQTFLERFEYLSLRGQVGRDTFGFDRWMNQEFYHSHEWRTTRRQVIVRDLGCDLGVDGYEIHEGILIHHINPLTPEDLQTGAELALDFDNLITTSHRTHNAIHYGDERLLPRVVIERKPGDTKLW